MKFFRLVHMRAQAGLTLIELMVALSIGLFLSGAIAGIYMTAQNIFSTTRSAIIMDENARTAFDWIGSSIRHTGFVGCLGPADIKKIAEGEHIGSPLIGDTRAGLDTDNNWWQRITDPVSGASLAAADSRFPGAVAGSDVLMLIGTDPAREAVVISDSASGITTGGHDFEPGETLLATDCQLNSFFVMTGTDGTGTVIEHGPSRPDGTPANCSTSLGGYCSDGGSSLASHELQPGALVVPVVASAYYIAPANSASKGNALWQATTERQGDGSPMHRELVNGIERIVLRFAVETGSDGSIDGYQNAASIVDWGQVMAIKVHLLLATLPDSGARSTGSNAYTFNGSTITPAVGDRRIYREYTAVFSLRNRSQSQ